MEKISKNIFHFSFIEADNIYDPDNDETCLLGHVESTLKFLDEAINTSNENATKKYKKAISESIFDMLDAKVILLSKNGFFLMKGKR